VLWLTTAGVALLGAWLASGLRRLKPETG
jgi:hypothetical protein